jgi:excisionase family DNA binding protein
MPSIVPLALQISEEQQQVINKIAASVAPLLGSCDCVLLTLILRKDGAESAEDQTTKRQPTAPENLNPAKQETFTVAEAAHLLNVNPTTVYRLIYIGQLNRMYHKGRVSTLDIAFGREDEGVQCLMYVKTRPFILDLSPMPIRT